MEQLQEENERLEQNLKVFCRENHNNVVVQGHSDDTGLSGNEYLLVPHQNF